MAEADEATSASETSSNLSGPSSFEKLDISSGSSAMSSVFGSSEKRSMSSTRSSSRTPSPSTARTSLSFHRRSSSHSGDARKKKDAKAAKEDRLARWLQGGNVIYKSVGLGLMDLAVGIKLIQLAREKCVGTHIEGF